MFNIISLVFFVFINYYFQIYFNLRVFFVRGQNTVTTIRAMKQPQGKARISTLANHGKCRNIWISIHIQVHNCFDWYEH